MRNVIQLTMGEGINFAGKNFPATIVVEKISGLNIQYDETKEEFLVHWNDRLGRIPKSWVKIWEEGTDKQVRYPDNEHTTHDIKKMVDAQVSTPHGHVFQGPGKGKTGRPTKQ